MAGSPLFNFRFTPGNFGDDLNELFMREVFPETPVAPFYKDEDPANLPPGATLILCIGTILNRRVPADLPKIVLGSGAGYGPAPTLDPRWSIRFVRGPHTARALDLPAALAVADPALVVNDFVRLTAAPRHAFGYMPHHYTANRLWEDLMGDLDILYIDPRRSVDVVLDNLVRVECLIAEAMHGAIVAEGLRVPWIPVTSAAKINAFKWNDWCASLELDYSPHRLFGLWDVAAGWRSAPKMLANRHLLRRLCRYAMPVQAANAAVAARASQLREHFAAAREALAVA